MFYVTYNTFIRFAGDNFYTLIDSNTYKVKANYKVRKLLGYYYSKYYRVELIDGTDCLMTDNGSLYDFDTKKLIHRIK